MILQPASPITPNIARIAVSQTAVLARFTERNNRFIKVARRLGYEWNGTYWEKRITKYTGAANDRAAEMGRALLEAGFPVEFPSEEIAEMATGGAYTPEQRLWIFKRTAGKHENWFVIQWPRGEDWYKEAKRLSGARYDPPGVVVPPERYDEILDFADSNGFSLSDGAKELVQKMKEERRSAVIADLKPIQPKTKPPAKPDHYEVADELRDDPL